MFIKNIIALSLLTFTTAVFADSIPCPVVGYAVTITTLAAELNQNYDVARPLGRAVDQLKSALSYSQTVEFTSSPQIQMRTDQAMKGFIDAAHAKGLDAGSLHPFVCDLKTYRAAYTKSIA